MGSTIKSPSKVNSKAELKLIKKEITDAHGNFGPGLSKRALFKTNDVEMSKDLVQTTFMKTFLYLQKGGKVEMMKSFLSHILNNLIIDEYRKHKNTSLDLLLEKGFEPGSDEYERTIDIFDGNELMQLVPLLPEKYQKVIRLRYINGLSLKEISVLTKQPENTAAVQIHRGLAKLKILYTQIKK